MTKDLTKIFADIDTFLYKYKDDVQEVYNDSGVTDDKMHIGVMAQELLENPLTRDCVIQDENGMLEVNTMRLTLTLAGIVAQLCKKVEGLEARLV